MPRLQFSTSINAPLSLSETQEMTEVLASVIDSLRYNGHTVTDDISIGPSTGHGTITAHFAVRIGTDS